LTLPIEGLMGPPSVIYATLIPWPLIPATLIRAPLVISALIPLPLIRLPLITVAPAVVAPVIVALAISWPTLLPWVSRRRTDAGSHREGGQPE